MADLIFLALGGGLFLAFAAFAAALRRVWPCWWTCCGQPGRWSSRRTWSWPCCGPTSS